MFMRDCQQFIEVTMLAWLSQSAPLVREKTLVKVQPLAPVEEGKSHEPFTQTSLGAQCVL
jgi:hypothetical protein